MNEKWYAADEVRVLPPPSYLQRTKCLELDSD